MATWTSSAFSTSNTYIKYKISITQNSQSIANNTSNVTVKVRFYRTNTGYTTYGTGTLTCYINGTKYTKSITSDHKITNSGIVLYSKTLNISHGSDGTKTLKVSASLSHSQFTASSHSYSHALTTIPRTSTLSVSNGTLGVAQTLTVTRKSTSFTHTIMTTCGSASSNVCTKSSSTSISYTPPNWFAYQNTTGTTLSVTYTITTYSGDTWIGSNSYTVTCTIPANFKPACTVSVSDPTGYASTYGGYVQLYSKMAVVVTATQCYSSAIKAYKTSANGGTFTQASFTTGQISGSGTLGISSTVTDARGRTGSAFTSITVLPYKHPAVTSLTVNRCNEDGTINQGGAYVKVTFNASVSSLNNKNGATYMIRYKKTSASSYGSWVTLSSYTGSYSVSNGSYIFAADTDSSYNVVVNAADNFGNQSRSTSVSTAFTLLHFSAGGTGLAIGKIVEEENLLDIGLNVKFNGNILSSLKVSSKSSMWIYGFQGNAAVDMYESGSASGFNALARVRAASGAWAMGVLNTSNNFYISYMNEDNLTNGTNSPTANFIFNKTGNFSIPGEFITTSANGLRLVFGNYGMFFRNDGNYFWMLPTSSGNPYGTWSGYYPFIYRFSTNTVQILNFIFDGAVLSNSSGIVFDNSSARVGLFGTESRFRVVVAQDANVELGASGARWKQLFAATTTIATSDERDKDIIGNFDDRHKKLFMSLKPIEFKWKDTSIDEVIHFGLGAQTTEQSILDSGFEPDSLAVINHSYWDEPSRDGRTDRYGMAYEEISMLTIPIVQEHDKRLEDLEKKLQEAYEEIAELKQK